MKKLSILFIATFLFSTTFLFSQASKTNDATPTKNTLQKFYFGLSNEPFGLTKGELTGWIVDDSPSQDWLLVDIDLANSKRATGLHAGVEYIYKSNFTWNADINFSFNKSGRMFGGNLGFGYRIGKEKVHIIPMLKMGLGNGNFKLGDIQNEDVYIQIDETQFFGDEVEARLKDLYAYVAPELNVFFALNDHAGLQISAGYKLAKNRKSKIEFSGTNEEDTSDTEFRSLGHSQNQLSLSGKKLTEESKLIDFKGISFKVSFVKYLWK